MFKFVVAIAISLVSPLYSTSARAVTLHPGDTVSIALSNLTQTNYAVVGLQAFFLGPDLVDVGESAELSYFSDATTFQSSVTPLFGTGNPVNWTWGNDPGPGSNLGHFLIYNIVGTFEATNFRVLASIDGNAFDEYDDGIVTFTPAVPLPAALPLFAAGLGAFGFMGWRKMRKAHPITALWSFSSRASKLPVPPPAYIALRETRGPSAPDYDSVIVEGA